MNIVFQNQISNWKGYLTEPCGQVSLFSFYLTLVLLVPDICPAFANSVDPDQLASEEAN